MGRIRQILFTTSNLLFDVTSGFSVNQAVTKIDDTLITQLWSQRPSDIAVDAQDKVQIIWDDTRGGKVELVFLIDTSGSMSNEWADVCSVIYGGNIGGGAFEGIKPMLEKANMTVLKQFMGSILQGSTWCYAMEIVHLITKTAQDLEAPTWVVQMVKIVEEFVG